jgi:hypothetical protein
VIIYQASSGAALAAAVQAPGAETVIAPEPEVGLYEDDQEAAQEENRRR